MQPEETDYLGWFEMIISFLVGNEACESLDSI